MNENLLMIYLWHFLQGKSPQVRVLRKIASQTRDAIDIPLDYNSASFTFSCDVEEKKHNSCNDVTNSFNAYTACEHISRQLINYNEIGRFNQ